MSTNHIVFWNARGLNSRARRSVVRSISHLHQASVVCLQETKIENISVSLNLDLTSSDFDYAALPASGAAGGAYTSWRRDLWDVSSVTVRRFSITVQWPHP
jgi:exonuclease III